jgi:hypothetical protein
MAQAINEDRFHAGFDRFFHFACPITIISLFDGSQVFVYMLLIRYREEKKTHKPLQKRRYECSCADHCFTVVNRAG